MPKRIARIILDAVGLDQNIATVTLGHCAHRGPKKSKVADAGYFLTFTMSRGMAEVTREACVTIRGSARVEYSMGSYRKLGQQMNRVRASGFSPKIRYRFVVINL